MARQQYLNFIEGADVMISPSLMSDNKLAIADNVNTSYKLGAILKRPGYSKVGSTLQANKSVTGLYNFRQSASTQKILATINDATGANLTLQYNNSGTWTAINVGSTYDGYEDALAEFETFLGYCFIVGYDSTDNVFLPVGSLTGTTFSTSAQVTSMPQGKYIVRYRDRLYVGNAYYSAAAYPYRVYYSSVPTAGSITWTPTTNFEDVDYAEQITGMGVNWDRLVIFTEYSAYIYDQSTKKRSWDIGCSNNRTIKNLGQYMIWANQDGVWSSTGGFPVNISGRMTDFIKAGTPSNFFAETVDEEYHLYVGTVTVQGITYTNCTIIFNLPTQTWRWAEYYDNFTVFSKFNSSGVKRLYAGTTGGMVMDIGKYTDSTYVGSDNTKPIQAMFRTKPYDWALPDQFKMVKSMTTLSDRAQGLQLKARILNNNTDSNIKPQSLGQLVKFINKLTPKVQQGELIQFEGVENSTNPYFSFYGFIVDVDQSTNN